MKLAYSSSSASAPASASVPEQKVGAVEKALKDAMQKIANPINWTQELEARDVNLEQADPCGVNAFSFCAIGALKSLLSSERVYQPALDLLCDAAKLVPILVKDSLPCNASLTCLNDYGELGHVGVIQCYEIAISNANGAGI